jgi:hypothetical protein
MPVEDHKQEEQMPSGKIARRRFVAGTAALSTAMVAAPFVRGAHAAGKLSLGFWDHLAPTTRPRLSSGMGREVKKSRFR